MERSGERPARIVILSLLTLAVLLPGLLSKRDFWVEDEARYAEVVREIRVDGRWLVPHLNSYIYPDKPPVYFWIATLITYLTGSVTPLSFLMVSWLSALGCVLVTYAFGRYLGDALSGSLGALVLLSSLLFLAAAQIVRMDMLFTLFTSLSLYCFYRGYKEEKGRFYTLFYLAAALAVLTKGPLGMAFTFIPAAACLWRDSGPGRWRRWLVHPGLILFVGLVLGWLLAAWAAGYHDLIGNIFGKQILERSLDAFKHREPFYYYFLALPAVFLPWTFFLPAAVAGHRRQRLPAASRLLIPWFGTGFLLISLVSGKLFIYLLPLLPPLAILVGNYLSRVWRNNTKPSTGFRLAAFPAATLTGGLTALLPWGSRYFPGNKISGLILPTAISLIFLGTAGAFVWLKKVRPLAVTLFLAPLLLSWTMFIHIAPQVNDFYSPRFLGEEIRQFCRQGYEIGSFRVTRGILNFYAGAEIRELDDKGLSRFFQTGNPAGKLLVIKSRHLEKIPRHLEGRTTVRCRRRMNNETYLLLTAGPFPEAIAP